MKLFLQFKLFFVLCLFSNIYAFGQLKIEDRKVNYGYRVGHNRNVDVIIVHSTYNIQNEDIYNIDLVLKQFRNYKVSSHYIINREGIVYRLVDEKNIAFHAGKSRIPDGRMGVNQFSIGIELINSISETPTELQIQSLVKLVTEIKSRYNIKYVLRHSDIAPTRKTDPWNMNWEDFITKISVVN